MSNPIAKDPKDRAKTENPQGPFGDTRPDVPSGDTRTNGSRPQEKVEDRENVSIVSPDDYPLADREEAQPK